jgi:hypothetical protein
MGKIFIFACFLTLSLKAHASCSNSEPWKVCASTDATANIITLGGQDIASSESVNDLFGLHSIWWSTQSGYMNTDGTFVSDSISKLKLSRPSIIRNGGDVNGINWMNCVGNLADRPLSFLALYNLSYFCKFGPGEYEKLNDQLGINSSWYIANIVGYNGNIQPFNTSMQQSLSQYVKYVRNLAPNKKIYWELGNELEFLSAEHWYAEEIVSRANVAASIIHSADPNAQVIMPLLAYTPSWMNEKNITYTKHNTDIITGTKGNVDGYSFHLYYDHKSTWVKVSYQLNYLAAQYSLVSGLGIDKPKFWITEHAVWPEGDSANHDEWKKNWYKTGNFDGMLSTADFITGLTQLPGISGSMYHSLGYAELWSFLVKDSNKLLSQSKISLLYQLFSPVEPMVSVNTLSESSIGTEIRAATVDKYSMPINQYRFRAAGFNVVDSNKKVIWIVNRGGDADITINANFNSSIKTVSIIEKKIVDNEDATDILGESTPIETVMTTTDLDNGAFKITSKNRSITVLDITPVSLSNTISEGDSISTETGTTSDSSGSSAETGTASGSSGSSTETGSASGSSGSTETGTTSGSSGSSTETGTASGSSGSTETGAASGSSSASSSGGSSSTTSSSSSGSSGSTASGSSGSTETGAASGSSSASSSGGSSSTTSSSSSGSSGSTASSSKSESSGSSNMSAQTPVIATYGFSAGALSADGSNANTLIASDESSGQSKEINNLSLVDSTNSSFKVLLQFKESSNVLVTSSDSGKVLVASEKSSGDEVAINSNEQIKISVSDLNSTAIYYNGELVSKSELNSQTDSDGMIVFQ